MSKVDNPRIHPGPDGVAIVDAQNNVATEGDSEEDARKMLEDALTLYNGEGRQLPDRELSNLGLDADDLDTRSIPDDFDQFSDPEYPYEPETIATVLMQHGFRPVARTEYHIQMIDIRNNIDEPIIIPIHIDELDAFVSGFIAGSICEDVSEVEPNHVLDWINRIA